MVILSVPKLPKFMKTKLTVKKRRITIFLFRLWSSEFELWFWLILWYALKQKSTIRLVQTVWTIPFSHVHTGVHNLQINKREIMKRWNKVWFTSHANKTRFVELFFMNIDDLFEIQCNSFENSMTISKNNLSLILFLYLYWCCWSCWWVSLAANWKKNVFLNLWNDQLIKISK